MRATVLHRVSLHHGGAEVPFPSGNGGRLLARLLLRPGEVHPAAELLALLWPGEPDDGRSRHRLQVTVSRLRRFLRASGPEETGGLDIVHDGDGDGYVLVAPTDSMDRAAFEQLAERALRRRDAALARRALTLWGGAPYLGLPVSPELRAQQTLLAEVRRQLTDLVEGPPQPGTLLQRGRVQPPGAVGAVVERSALLAAIPAVGEVAAIAVVAPAGFGKSTLIAQWAAQQAVPVAWLSLDDAHDDPARFWTGLLHSLRWATGQDIVVPDGVTPGSPEFLDTFSELVDPDGSGFGIVLDDLHRIEKAAAADVARLLDALPGSCTLVLASRAEPPIPARWEVSGRLFRVESADLAFSVDEVAAATGADVGSARHLRAVTEGWPVAVVAIHRSGAAVPDVVPKVIDRYVVEEVLRAVPHDVARLLLELAHLDAFNPDLGSAAVDRDVRASLAWLRDHGLFLVDLGPTMGEGWSRLHHLVASVARRHSASEVDASALLRRAAQWCRANGLDEEALDYAVRAGDTDTVTAVAGDVILTAALRGEAHTCVHWLRRIPMDVVAGDLRAHSVAVYLATEWMKVEEREAWLRHRRRHFGGDDDLVLKLIEATGAMRSGRSTMSVELTQEVIDGAEEYSSTAPEMAPVLRASAASNQVRARAFQGTAPHDDPIYPDTVALLRPHGPMLATWVHSYWGLVAYVEGNLDLADALAEEFYRGRRAKELSRAVRRDNSVLGALLAARSTSDPDRLRHLAEGIADLPPHLGDRGQHTDAAVAELALASIHARAGDQAQARDHQARADLLLQTFEDAPLLDRLQAGLAEEVAQATAPEPVGGLDVLTPRQQTIAVLLASDRTARELADDLHISHHTLRTHLREIYNRLGVRSRHQAVLAIHAE